MSNRASLLVLGLLLMLALVLGQGSESVEENPLFGPQSRIPITMIDCLDCCNGARSEFDEYATHLACSSGCQGYMWKEELTCDETCLLSYAPGTTEYDTCMVGCEGHACEDNRGWHAREMRYVRMVEDAANGFELQGSKTNDTNGPQFYNCPSQTTWIATDENSKNATVILPRIMWYDNIDADTEALLLNQTIRGYNHSRKIGLYEYRYSAADSNYNQNICFMSVRIYDGWAPVLSGCPAGDDVYVAVGAGETHTPTWVTPTAEDVVDGSVAVVESYPSGQPLSGGTYNITFSAQDAYGNKAVCFYSLEITDEAMCGNTQAASVCENGGNCTNSTCACAAGYEGYHCEVDIDDCASEPCDNGVCVDGVDGFTCDCEAGYTDTLCGTDIDDCASEPCDNGVCVDGVDGFTCDCEAGYTDTLCGTDIDDCASEPCDNGVCVDGVDGFTCDCETGYTDTLCGTNIDDCAGTPCLNGGICADLVDGFTCDCATGYTGTLCGTGETETLACSSDPCENGDCEEVEDSDEFVCICDEFYSGEMCEFEIDISGNYIIAATSDNTDNVDTGNLAVANGEKKAGPPIALLAGCIGGAVVLISLIVFFVNRKRKKGEIAPLQEVAVEGGNAYVAIDEEPIVVVEPIEDDELLDEIDEDALSHLPMPPVIVHDAKPRSKRRSTLGVNTRKSIKKVARKSVISLAQMEQIRAEQEAAEAKAEHARRLAEEEAEDARLLKEEEERIAAEAKEAEEKAARDAVEAKQAAEDERKRQEMQAMAEEERVAAEAKLAQEIKAREIADAQAETERVAAAAAAAEAARLAKLAAAEAAEQKRLAEEAAAAKIKNENDAFGGALTKVLQLHVQLNLEEEWETFLPQLPGSYNLAAHEENLQRVARGEELLDYALCMEGLDVACAALMAIKEERMGEMLKREKILLPLHIEMQPDAKMMEGELYEDFFLELDGKESVGFLRCDGLSIFYTTEEDEKLAPVERKNIPVPMVPEAMESIDALIVTYQSHIRLFRFRQIRTIAAKIGNLSNLLRIPRAERAKWIGQLMPQEFESDEEGQEVEPITLELMDKYRAELKRLQAGAQKQLKRLVPKVVERLEKLWKLLDFTEAEKDHFYKRVPQATWLTLDGFDKLQTETIVLGKEEKIRAAYKEHQAFVQRVVDFETGASDKNRLFGSSLRLLEEEKFRKNCYPMLRKHDREILLKLRTYVKMTGHRVLLRGVQAGEQDMLTRVTDEVHSRPQNMETTGLGHRMQ